MRRLIAALFITISYGFNAFSTERSVSSESLAASDDDIPEYLSGVDGGPMTDAKSDILFKYTDPNIYVSGESATLVLPYGPVSNISFDYLICKDMVASYGDYAVEYRYGAKWNAFGMSKKNFFIILCRDFLGQEGGDGRYQTNVTDWRNNEIIGIKKKIHYYFKPITNLVCFSPGDVVGVDISNEVEVKNFIMDNVRCADRNIGFGSDATSIEMRAGKKEWVTAVIDRKACTVTFKIKPNNTGNPRSFTFVMGGAYDDALSPFLDNGVIVHQAAR